MSSIKRIIRNVLYRGITKDLYENLARRKLEKTQSMDEEEYIRKRFREDVGGELDLDDPKTLNEKLNWLKLHDIHPEYGKLVDKYEVKKYVAEKVGEKYLIPCLGVWDRAEDIDFDSLPEEFILKVTHDSGGRVICRNKADFDEASAIERLNRLLETDFYKTSREYPYKYASHRIIAEPFIESLGHDDSIEYKLTVCNGKVRMITVCQGRAHEKLSDRTNDHYDPEGNILPFYVYYRNANPPVPLPPQTEEMIEVAEKLAGEIPYVRVDFYIDNNKVLFGEMTFFTWGAFMVFTPKEWDLKMGEWVTLPKGE